MEKHCIDPEGGKCTADVQSSAKRNPKGPHKRGKERLGWNRGVTMRHLEKKSSPAKKGCDGGGV